MISVQRLHCLGAVFAIELGKDVARMQEAAATVASAVEEAEAALTARREESAAADEDIRRTGDDLAEAQERHRSLAKDQRRLEARHACLPRFWMSLSFLLFESGIAHRTS